MAGKRRHERCCIACFAVSQVNAKEHTAVCKQLKRQVSTVWGYRPEDCPVERGGSC